MYSGMSETFTVVFCEEFRTSLAAFMLRCSVFVRFHCILLPRMKYHVRYCDIFWLLNCLHNFDSTLQPLPFLDQGTLRESFVLHHQWRFTLMRHRILIGLLWLNISQVSKIHAKKFRNLESCFKINLTQLRTRSFFSHIICSCSKLAMAS